MGHKIMDITANNVIPRGNKSVRDKGCRLGNCSRKAVVVYRDNRWVSHTDTSTKHTCKAENTAAVRRSRKVWVCRNTSVSRVPTPGEPKVRTSEYAVEQYTKSTPAEAPMAGIKGGSVIVRNARAREAPRLRAASTVRGSSICHKPPT